MRLRAPFLIGAGVLVVHALAQLWPWIREASATVPWWAWAGVGGVVLIAVAARYERRIRDVKEVAARVSALR
ncbi:SCO7613 C-terminal domain-containing membrane protein [Clavibacter zhangzhiyongii]|uniref:SCO7613 C-terminal domain-containing membrane protein n=1 Tax=Clavibacter zhangzhiyongii TaxID=2768071 RepID=UPI0039E0F280